MKKVFLVILLLAGMVSFAQEHSNRKDLTSEQRVEKHVSMLKKQLTLTDDQTTSVRNLLIANAKQREDKTAQLKEMKTDSKKLTPEEKALLTDQMNEKQMATEEQMKGILSPEQFSKWQAGREKRKAKMMQKREEKKATK